MNATELFNKVVEGEFPIVLNVDENGKPYGHKLINGIPRINVIPYTYSIAKGDVEGHTALYKFGSNADIGTNEETIWEEGGLYNWDALPYLLGGGALVGIASTSANDTSNGTGARTCTIYGLGSHVGEANLISETITLNGQNKVVSANSYQRVNRVVINTAGSSGKNEGIVYVGTGNFTTGVPDYKWASIGIGDNQTLMAIWTVPQGKTFYMTAFTATTNSNKGLLVRMYAKPFGSVFQIKNESFMYSTGIREQFTVPLKFEELTDIDCRAKGVATGAGVSFTFEGWYE